MRNRTAAALLAFGCALSVAAQEFEGASVRVSTAPGLDVEPGTATGGPGTPTPGQIVYHNLRMRRILSLAFGVRSDRIEGPAWLDDMRYEIVAKVPPGASRQQSGLMMQHLLAERFAIQWRRETRMVPGYELTVSPKGLRMKSIDQGTPMSGIVAQLGLWLHGPVADRTGLTAKYDFVFYRSGPPDAPDADQDLIRSLEAQLGLRLIEKKVLVDVLVIEQMNKIPAGD